jgi:RNA polymerase sigma factor (sigma-70 family)
VKPLMVAAPAEATDDELVVAAQQGSDAAFEALFRRYRDRITAYVRGIVSDHARAEDIVQDAFMSALRNLRSNQREVAFKPWIYEIAKNACIDHIRRARRTSEVSIDSDDFSPVDEGRLSAGVASTDAAYSARENMDTLRMAFNDLPSAQREVLISREFEGLSYDTISNRTGLSRSAVESMLFRARRTLKDGYDDIATGERCQRMQTVMTHLTDGQIGLRQERRLVRHLRDCAGCRREAIALGLDDLALGAPSRTRSAVSRVAAFLPLPAFLRRRWLDGSGLVGSTGSGAADQGLSLAGKAAIVLAAAAIAGGGAGAVHKAGALGTGGGSSKGTPAARGAGSSGKSLSSGGSVGSGAAGQGAGRGSRGPRTGGGSGSNGAGGGLGAGAGGAGGDAGGPLGSVGGLVNGAGGKAGVVAGGGASGTAGGITNGAGGTVNGVGGTVNGTLDGAGGTVDSTVKGVTGTLDNTTKGATDPISKTVTGVTGSKPVSGTTDTLNTTITGVTGTATGAAGSLTSPTQPAPGSTSLLKPGL